MIFAELYATAFGLAVFGALALRFFGTALVLWLASLGGNE